jgi:hypothetical protein
VAEPGGTDSTLYFLGGTTISLLAPSSVLAEGWRVS